MMTVEMMTIGMMTIGMIDEVLIAVAITFISEGAGPAPSLFVAINSPGMQCSKHRQIFFAESRNERIPGSLLRG